MSLQHQAYILEPSAAYPLYVTAKRYWYTTSGRARQSGGENDDDGLTLIWLHSTSFCKEIWEPTMERVFALAARDGSDVRIREAWAIDCPNHGASAAMNEQLLQQPEFFHNFTCEKYARAVQHFLLSSPANFTQRKGLVGIGHSLGGVAMTFLSSLPPPKVMPASAPSTSCELPFISLTLVEPMISPAGSEYVRVLRMALVRSAYERRDVWRSREDAKHFLETHQRARKWDRRLIPIFVEHALREHPGAKYEGTPYTGVTLACTRDQEAAMYRDAEGAIKPVTDLNRACARMPVHVVFGGVNDFLTREVHDAVTEPASGRKFASITRLPGVGHLVPQEAPDALGDVIFATLPRTLQRSKL